MYIREIKKQEQFNLLKKANVYSVAIGYKQVKGEKTKNLAIVVGVGKKLPCAQLSRKESIPFEINGIPIDIVELGNIRAFSIDPKKKHRPIFPGISVGHKNVTCGSIACFVNRDGEKVLLSNNHVLSDSNEAEIGDEIWSPGSFDFGDSSCKIGELLDFIPIYMGGTQIETKCNIFEGMARVINKAASLFDRKHRMVVVDTQAKNNEVDAAICSVDVDYKLDIPEIGVPKGIVEPNLGMEVHKFGRTTSYTTGTVEQIDVTVNVAYGEGPNKVATFEDQIILSPMSAGGDSGSAICTKDGNLTALLFAGSDKVTIASPMSKVFRLLNLSL